MFLRGLAILALVTLFVSAGACGSTTTPTAPKNTVAACETNHTATVRFENRSVSTTMDVVWDGSKMATVAPGQTTEAREIAAGLHTLVFMVTNTTNWACTPSTPNLAQCSNMRYWCPS